MGKQTKQRGGRWVITNELLRQRIGDGLLDLPGKIPCPVAFAVAVLDHPINDAFIDLDLDVAPQDSFALEYFLHPPISDFAQHGFSQGLEECHGVNAINEFRSEELDHRFADARLLVFQADIRSEAEPP